MPSIRTAAPWGLSLLLLALVARGEAPARAAAPTFYVATNGNDRNPGTLQAPWRTVQRAANAVPAGSQVFVRGGIYREAVTVRVSGSANAGYTVFRNYPGEIPILDGTGLVVPEEETGAFLLVNRSYITIQGFDIRNYRTAAPDRVPVGIHVRGAGHHLCVLNNHVHHLGTDYRGDDDGNAHGIAVFGTSAPQSINNLVIDGNEVDHLKLGFSEAVVLNGNVERFQVTNNRIHDTNNIALDLIGFEGTAPDPMYDRARNGVVTGNRIFNVDSAANPAYGGDRSAGGIYVDGGRNILIERNSISAADIGIELASERRGRFSSYVTVRNNLLFRNLVTGISIGGYDTLRGGTDHCFLVNNTLFQNDTTRSGTGEVNFQYNTTANVFANNIVYANSQAVLLQNPFTQNTGNVLDYNVYFVPGGAAGTWQWKTVTYTGFSTYRARTGNDPHSAFLDPRLVNLATPDLHLQAISPAINAGINRPDLGATDIDGQARIQGGRVDIGADERR